MSHTAMTDLAGKTAVITGAGSGLGRAIAIECAAAGMNVVLSDVDESGLDGTAAVLALSARALQFVCDVSAAAQVERLAAATYATFGAAHLLFNNAGVVSLGPLWTTTPEDWSWTLGVNLMGVVHGIRSFVPRMLEQGDACHVVNTASAAGLIALPGSGVYCASKHAVVAVSECLDLELRQCGARIGVSVLCPAFVRTGIANSARNRPAELAATSPLAAAYQAEMDAALDGGRLSAADIAAITIEAVKENRFYILTHPKIKGAIDTRFQDIIAGRSPTPTAKPPR